MNVRMNPAAVELAQSIGAYLELSLTDNQKALLMGNYDDGGATELVFHSSQLGGFIQVVVADKTGARAAVARVALMPMHDPSDTH